MGTAITVELWHADAPSADAAIDAVMGEMHRIDRAMSPFKPESELSRINRDAPHGPVLLSHEMARLVERAIGFSQRSGGAFDITYASVGHLFDYRARVRPGAAELEQARAGIGWQHLLLDCQERTLRFAHPLTRIDLGGFAKGHAVDNAVALLRDHGVRHAIVSAGGDSRVLGDRGGRPWTVAIRDPRDPQRVVAVLPLEDVAISTSGDYERFFEEDGVRFHHLIDPHTGASPADVCSVTILAPDGLTAEGLSKSVFVMGVERGLQLIESTPGVDAVVIDAAQVLHCSSGFLDGGSPTRQ